MEDEAGPKAAGSQGEGQDVAPGGGAAEAADPVESLAEQIGAILQRQVHQFLQWGEQFMNWATSQQMNGFQVPSEAYADYRGRLDWTIGFVEQFAECSSILSAAGQGRPAALVGQYLEGLRGLKARLEGTLGAMQADDFATGRKIRQIGEQMFDTNVQAAATRLGIQRGTDAAVAATHGASYQRQQQSFDVQVGRMMSLFR